VEEKSQKNDEKVGQHWLWPLLPLVYGMCFNGTVYGYTSPALVTLQNKKCSCNVSHEQVMANQSETNS